MYPKSKTCRPQRGLNTSDAQTSVLVHICAIEVSTSTRIEHLGCPELGSGAHLCDRSVDLNEDGAPRMPRTRLSCASSRSEESKLQAGSTWAQNAYRLKLSFHRSRANVHQSRVLGIRGAQSSLRSTPRSRKCAPEPKSGHPRC